MIQKKQLLMLCTGNSCRSIMAEAIINVALHNSVHAQSAGVQASGYVNEDVKKLLKQRGYWIDSYHSKKIDDILDTDFDLIITVCDNAKESCPIFPKTIKTIHVGFEDPSGKAYFEYEKTLQLMKKELLPIIKKEFCN